eukprot:TRINITY_DN12598_c0_g1_i3.p3 TRINITY_DN12598_c0_g1~~TRINITY_DN12598_c0_g1_i3.p3  ORF type:complete len:114 (+),score=17.77 TRINITY_DN12598_c0_g1_i3:568-909(+)
MRYVFRFNADYTRAEIDSPILGGLTTLTDLSQGRGSSFIMERVEGSDGSEWRRRSFRPDGSAAFPDYYPTRVAVGGVACDSNLRRCLSTIAGHPLAESSPVDSGGATAVQLLR